MQGQCLCQAVSISIAGTRDLHACHCGICRRWSGGPGFALSALSPTIRGTQHIRRYRSSQWAERAFCADCGTHLYYHLLGTEQYYLYAGLFPAEQLHLSAQIYTDCQAPYAALAAATPKLSEAEFLATLGQSE